jgi:hypothetical protein
VRVRALRSETTTPQPLLAASLNRVLTHSENAVESASLTGS